MSIVKSFDFIAALSPALRQAIDQGKADPHRWRMVDGKLIEIETGNRLYREDKSDEEIENEAIAKWQKKIECLQLIPAQDFKIVMETYRKEWQSHGFQSIESLRINSIHDSAEDYQTHWACSQIADFIDENNIRLNTQPDRYDSGLLIIYGMGSCQSISHLISIVKPRIILIFEEDVDIISTMLSELKAAEILLSATNVNKSSLFFITDSDTDLATSKANELIEMISLRAKSYCFSFTFRKSTAVDTIDKELFCKDSYARSLRFKGFFTDELHMLLNAILTFSHTDTEIIHPKKISRTKRHAVIVASGPSLRAELPKLKKNRAQYDLFCAFSTLGTVINENIIPDYHCHIERHSDQVFVQTTDELREFCKNSILLTSANVDPRLAQVYKKVYAILRSASSSSALVVQDPDEIVYSEGTNAGTFAVTVAILLGYDVIHIFGLDLGAIDPSDLRIENALNKSMRKMNIEVNGNLRESVWTDQYLLDSSKVLGLFLDSRLRENNYYGINSEQKVYNYSDGQKIPHTIPSFPSSFEQNLKSSQSTPHTFVGEKSKEMLKRKNYNIYNKIIASDLESKIRLQCQIMRNLSNTPLDDNSLDLFLQSCTDRKANFSDRGSCSDQILIRLLSGSITRIWIYISILSRHIPKGIKHEWEKKSNEILKSCIDSMESLSIEMIQYSLSIEKLEQHNLQSIYLERRDKL